MAVFSLGAVENLNPDGSFHSSSVTLRITNTTAAALSPIVVHAYSAPGSAPPGTAAVPYFLTTFALAANAVVTLTIPTVVPAYIINVSSPAPAAIASDISIAAQGKDAAGNFVPEHTFPFGDWTVISTVGPTS
ncbi:hypothetical protein G9G63_11970 [Paenibacillus sp. EKM202P]|uniref:hypothetical protein n=1 Tax=unclassified Paenibacillus TaxID=185978 RepID=UPI0013EC958C|nr:MULTISPECIES: hypothetical protein [unclassified Paenibacillus]KAF6564042.1 hypothetical protein G9G63_11970 [Paenibacillus sp. EKM202P]KAF6571088.1 hypothetical protein G9G64_07120 [Paenibacillus sp. EKM207P]